MHLYRLRLGAIGPFPGVHAVDFDRLGASGLFLLEGPTGAGKSTLIDALVFALYGKVAGADASDDRMYSGFAAPGVEPFVELDFETTSGLYRVRRTPRYERPKARGEGTTVQNATAKLWRLTSPDAEPDDDALATSVTEVGEWVSRVVGLTRLQFVKTVVLPQGEFAAFLRADAEERRELLQRLFGTEVYERVRRRLEELRREAAEQRTRAGSAVEAAVATFVGAVGLSGDQREAFDAHLAEPDVLLPLLDAIVTDLEGEVASLATELTTASAAAVRAAEQLATAREREQLCRDKRQLLARKASLAEAEAAVGLSRQRLAAAQRAEAVRAVLVGRRDAGARLDAAEGALEQARSALPEASGGLDPVGWAAAEQARRASAERIRDVVVLEQALPAREAELALAEELRSELAKRLDEVVAVLDELPDRLARLRSDEDSTRLVAATRDSAERALAATSARSDAAVQVSLLGGDLRDAEAVVRAAAARATAAQADEDVKQRRYIAAMAGHLAAGLSPGKPCPVCGSIEHPDTAELAPDAVRAEDVDAAEQVRKHAMGALETASGEKSRLAAELAAASAEAGGLDEDQARSALTDARAALGAAEQAVVRLTSLQRERAEAEGDQTRLERERATLAEQRGEAEGQVVALSTALTADRHRVEAERGSDPSVTDRCRRLEAEAEALAAVVRAAVTAAARRADLDQRAQEARDIAVRQGFADATAAEAAVLDEGVAEQLRRRVDEHDRAVVEVELRLAEPQLASLDVDDVPDVEPLVEAEKAAATAARHAADAHTRAELRSAGAVERRGDVSGAYERQARVTVETTPVIRMANLASANTADNALSMALPTFVLRERFRDVVAAANLRLAVMSDGRYGLEHVDDKEGGKRAGLGLVVVDNHTDKPRSPRTLSGGETFYCSLALALGLADVVTSEAGGIDLGTLFVDEGFGTLDPDTLDHVLSVLSGLRTGGRTVGIVSHVAELKERIAERVTVRRQPDGSSRLEVVA